MTPTPAQATAYAAYVAATNCDPDGGTCDCVEPFTDWLTWQEA